MLLLFMLTTNAKYAQEATRWWKSPTGIEPGKKNLYLIVGVQVLGAVTELLPTVRATLLFKNQGKNYHSHWYSLLFQQQEFEKVLIQTIELVTTQTVIANEVVVTASRVQESFRWKRQR